ncbi:MAG: hypothetical protein RMI01_09210 [Thermodesulfovibrio sp.]|nr:hypothetical protein [Thermodesulfovibrio sp.]
MKKLFLLSLGVSLVLFSLSFIVSHTKDDTLKNLYPEEIGRC